MTIEQRMSSDGKITYRVRVRVRGYPPATATFKRKTDAREWEERTRARIKEQDHFPHRESQRRTVAELLDRYEADVLPHKRRDDHHRRVCLRWWRSQIGAYKLSAIDRALIATTRNKLLDTRAKSTANRYLAALSHVFSTAVDWGWMRQNPCADQRLAEPPGRNRFLNQEDPEEMNRLLDACRASQNPALYAIVALTLSTGMRKGEVKGLTWDRVDLKNGVIRLEQTKNGERRLVPLVGHARDVLRDLSKVRRIDTKLVFPGNDPRKPVDFEESFRTALRRAKVEDFRFHDLRHSAGSFLAMNGATPSEIAAVLGHKTLAMVKRYAHLTDPHVSNVVARMNDAVFGGSNV